MSSKALIESIAKSAEKLVEQNRRLRSEVERLEAAREKLRNENRRLETENAALGRRIALGELASGFAGHAGREAPGLDRHGAKIARTRVNRLLREVDRCIALLNKD